MPYIARVRTRMLGLFAGLALLAAVCSTGVVRAQDAEQPPSTSLSKSEMEKLAESESLWKKGYSFLSSGELENATKSFDAAIKIEREVYGDGHDRILQILPLLAQMYELQQQFQQAALVRRDLEKILIKKFGVKNWQTVDAGIEAGFCEFRAKLTPDLLAKLQEAQRVSREGRELYEKGELAAAGEKIAFMMGRYRDILGEKHPYYAVALGKLAAVNALLGNFAKAESLYQAAIRIEQEVLGDAHPEYATTLNNLAVLCDEIGDSSRAEKLHRQAMDIRRNAFGEMTSEYASSLNNLAVHFEQLGDYERAKPLFLRAVELKRQILGESHADYIVSLGNLGRYYLVRGRLADAEPILKRTAELAKQKFGENHPEYATRINNLALFYNASQDYQQAEAAFTEALDIWMNTLGESHFNYATTLSHYADLLVCRNELTQAERHYRRVIEIRRAALGNDHPHVALASWKLSLCLEFQKKRDEALKIALTAATSERQYVEAVSLVQSDRQQLMSTRQHLAALDAVLTIAASDDRVNDEVYQEVLLAKGRVWHRQQTVRAMARTAQTRPELSTLMDQLKSVAARRATLTLNLPDPKEQLEWRKNVFRLTEDQENLERLLSEKSDVFRAATSEITPQKVRDALPAGTILVDVYQYLHSLPPESGKPTPQEFRSIAFILEPGKSGATIIRLGKVEELKTLIDTWLRSYGEESASIAAAEQLRKTLILPLEPQMKDATRILFSPDGQMARFPINALPGKKLNTYLIEDFPIAVIPCAVAIPGMLAPDQNTRKATEGNFLIVGNIDYDSTTPGELVPFTKFGQSVRAFRSADWKRFTPLAGTRGEMASLEGLYRSIYGEKGVTILQGAQAKEDRFCAEAEKHMYLHVATHGFFAPSPLRSILRDSQSSRGSAISLSSEFDAVGVPPGLLSGIALAGANRPPEAGSDDGILTALEVENLDLRGVKLAVLSACETGLGEESDGEGLLGLQRAFHVAGAQTVVASLWEVPDTATRLLMERFYENLLRQKSPLAKLDALREAQIWMIRDGQTRELYREDAPLPGKPRLRKTSPFYWAGFVLSGDWR